MDTVSRSQWTICCTDGTTSVSSLPLERSFVSRLPPELLAAIFLEYAQSYDPLQDVVWYHKMRVSPWVAVSYVCRYWRNVALGCANIWANIFFVTPRWTDELFRRSNPIPLTIHFNCSELYNDPFFPDLYPVIHSLEKALENMERIQHLWINVSLESVDQILRSRLIAAAPLLQSLSLSFEDNSSFVLSKDMFSGPMPGLQRVDLETCFVDWSSPIFSGLTELSLHLIRNDFMDNWEGLLLILRQVPRLRRLDLYEVLERATADEITSIGSQNIHKPISLPQLENLTIIDPISSMTLLITWLKFPMSTILELQCYLDDSWTISGLLPLIMDNFSSHPASPQSATSTQMVLRYLDFCHDRCHYEVEYGTSIHTHDHGTSIFSLAGQRIGSKISTCMDYGLSSYEILQWFRTFPLAHINVITLDNLTTDDEMLWKEVFQDTPRLYIIQVTYCHIEGLIHALHPRDGVILVPALTNIGFTSVEFERGDCSSGNSHIRRRGCLACLHSALASRAEAGNTLQRLDFGNCTGITKEDVTRLFSKVVDQTSGPM